MKIFVSQPMSGRKREDVLNEREKYVTKFLDSVHLVKSAFIEVIENYDKPDAPADAKQPWFLGDSLKQMSEADIVLFVPGWRKAKGCRIEMECCKTYGIKYIKMAK